MFRQIGQNPKLESLSGSFSERTDWVLLLLHFGPSLLVQADDGAARAKRIGSENFITKELTFGPKIPCQLTQLVPVQLDP